MRSLSLTFQLFSWRPVGRSRRKPFRQCSATGGSVAGRMGPDFGGFEATLKAGITCGALAALGDILSQLIAQRVTEKDNDVRIDITRILRMGSFGLVLYGPIQHYWYNLLGFHFPLKISSHFLTKVALNQLVLGPVVAAAAFVWTLALQGKGHLIINKIHMDFLTTLVTGWKFWIPASSLNFYWIPVPRQVLYMSTCSLLWTAYLSYACNKDVGRTM